MAESLVQELRADRQFAGTLRRPIIFICHGLGGVLLKRSLIYSSTRTAPKVVHLWDQFVSTFAILFFGTPHGRSAAASWLALEQMSRPSRPGSKSLFHRRSGSAIGENFQLPQSVSNDFMPLVKQFHMFFLWEALQTPFRGRAEFVVDPESAVPKLDNTESAAIHATHSGMVKFGSASSSDYRTVTAAVLNYCEKAPEIIAHRWEQTESVLRQLRASEAWELGGYGFDVHLEKPFRHQNIAVNEHFYPPQETTATFVGRRAELRTLHSALFPTEKGGTDGSKSIYVVFGMGDSGKTQFCSKFAHEYKQRYDCVSLALRYLLLTSSRYTSIFTIYAASRDTIVDSFCRIGKLAGLEATENAGRHFLSQLTGPWLLIMDNADDPTLELEEYYPPGNAAHILVMTRNPDFRRQGTRGSLELGGLSSEDALQLLLVKADISSPWDVSTREAAGVITKALGYLALALIQAGNCIYRQLCKLGDYLSLHSAARSTHRRRKALATDKVDEDEIIRVVYSTFDVSLGLLPKQPTLRRDAADLLRIFSFFHFEHIPVQMLERAFKNRTKNSGDPPSNRFASRISGMLLRRLQPPEMLPNFLKLHGGEPDKYRILRAIVELRSLSLINFDGRYISLHPLVHAWARDTLSNMEQKVWLGIALNTLLESISLPGSGGGDVDCEFHRDVLPHLEVCLQEHGSPVSDWVRALEGPWLRVSLILQPTTMLIIGGQVQRAAKCGFVFAERGLFEKARAHLHVVKDVLVRTLGEANDKTQSAILGLAATYWELGQVGQAISLQRVVVDARGRVLGPMHEQTLLAMDHLGRSYWLHGLHREALELQQTTTERMKSVIGPTHALYLQALAAMDNLGVTLSAWRRYADSAAVHREVLEARMTTLGETHTDTLATKANLAMALLDIGRLKEARENMEVVYEERQRQLGKEHPWTLWALCYLAKVWIADGELDIAEDRGWGAEFVGDAPRRANGARGACARVCKAGEAWRIRGAIVGDCGPYPGFFRRGPSGLHLREAEAGASVCAQGRTGARSPVLPHGAPGRRYADHEGSPARQGGREVGNGSRGPLVVCGGPCELGSGPWCVR